MLFRGTVATWILAISTAPLALEGGTAVRKWTDRLRPGRTRRELDQACQPARRPMRENDENHGRL